MALDILAVQSQHPMSHIPLPVFLMSSHQKVHPRELLLPQCVFRTPVTVPNTIRTAGASMLTPPLSTQQTPPAIQTPKTEDILNKSLYSSQISDECRLSIEEYQLHIATVGSAHSTFGNSSHSIVMVIGACVYAFLDKDYSRWKEIKKRYYAQFGICPIK